MSIPRKKRNRYKTEAMWIAREKGIYLNPEDWDSIWNLLDEHEERKYVYAIVDFQNKLVKFGRSSNVGVRLKNIKTGNALKLDIWAYCHETEALSEKTIHAQCKPHRVAGEWFKLNPDTQGVINQIRRQAGIQ